MPVPHVSRAFARHGASSWKGAASSRAEGPSKISSGFLAAEAALGQAFQERRSVKPRPTNSAKPALPTTPSPPPPRKPQSDPPSPDSAPPSSANAKPLYTARTSLPSVLDTALYSPAPPPSPPE